jgi:hypothetical protein
VTWNVAAADESNVVLRPKVALRQRASNQSLDVSEIIQPFIELQNIDFIDRCTGDVTEPLQSESPR